MSTSACRASVHRAEQDAVDRTTSSRLKRCRKCNRLLAIGAFFPSGLTRRRAAQPCKQCTAEYLRVYRANRRISAVSTVLTEAAAAVIARQAVADARYVAARRRAMSVVDRADTSADALREIEWLYRTVAAAAAVASGPRVSGAELAAQIEAMKAYTVDERRRIVEALSATLPAE